jgi:hypothetical protein
MTELVKISTIVAVDAQRDYWTITVFAPSGRESASVHIAHNAGEEVYLPLPKLQEILAFCNAVEPIWSKGEMP